MKKLLILAASATALSGVAMAQSQNAGSGQIVGVMPPVCGVDDLFASQSFDSLTAGATITDGFGLVCNDADGATLTIISTENGLESGDREDAVLNYTVAVSGTGVDEFDALSLTTTGNPFQSEGGQNDISVSASSGPNDARTLAEGVTDAQLTITLNEDAIWAGGYSDTIQLQISAE